MDERKLNEQKSVRRTKRQRLPCWVMFADEQMRLKKVNAEAAFLVSANERGNCPRLLNDCLQISHQSTKNTSTLYVLA